MFLNYPSGWFLSCPVAVAIRKRRPYFLLQPKVALLLIGMITGGMIIGCGSGTGNTSQQPTSPSNLVYPQTSITATLGQAITADTPTVTGTVTSFTVSPALPAGLSLNATTGAISGTPATVTAQASYTVTATNSSGSTTAAIKIAVNPAPPSNLVYPQTSITATVGQAIATDTPTVTGTVTSFTISPVLPVGLSLNATTGAISGAPTTVATQATYTVTATNSSGSTTATIQIVVSQIPPSSLVYPQTSITAIAGQAIQPDIPVVAGQVTSYTVSPALPAGLSLNATTGVISGTPSAVTAQTTYSVTAQNTGGNISAGISITVLASATSLLELGQTGQIEALQFSGNSALSMDSMWHWVLWNYSSGAIIASGDGGNALAFLQLPSQLQSNTNLLQMAGSTAVIFVQNGLEIISTTTGQVISIIPVGNQTGSWWQLATDGSYIALGNSSGLSIYSPSSGQLVASRQGNYSSATASATPGAIYIANGPAGVQVIETVSPASGTSTVSSTFAGSFAEWFVDGSGHFLTNADNTTYVYSSTGAELATMDNSNGGSYLGGSGNWIWHVSPPSDPLSFDVYSIGSSTPALQYQPGSAEEYVAANLHVYASGTTIALLPYGLHQLSIIDISGSAPAEKDYALPAQMAYLSAFAATSSSQWVVGNAQGVLLDGASLASTVRYLDYGAALSMAGTTNELAIATANGEILVYNTASSTPIQTIDFPTSKLELSSDGTILGAAANSLNAQYSDDRSLIFYSLPSGNVLYDYSYSYNNGAGPMLTDFELSQSGSTISQTTVQTQSGSTTYSRQVTGISGSPVIWSDSSMDPVYPSPDGTLIAINYGQVTLGSQNPASVSIAQGSTVLSTAGGLSLGWANDTQILVNLYQIECPQANCAPTPTGTELFDQNGNSTAIPNFPVLSAVQFMSSDELYSPSNNTIYSLPSGSVVWTGSSYLPVNSRGVGAVYGSNAAFESTHSILLLPF